MLNTTYGDGVERMIIHGRSNVQKEEILNKAEKYYTEKVLEHGNGPQASDWNSVAAQEIRFEQLTKILPIDNKTAFSICDYGCGTGDFESYIGRYYQSYSYYGYDVSAEMVDKAKNTHVGVFYHGSEILSSYDYIVASGIFNVRQNVCDEDWLEYIIDTLQMFYKYACKGFAFNCLTKYSDTEYMKKYLYYADPLYLFDFCKKNFSKNVALLHDYNIYDFTILVRRDST